MYFSAELFKSKTGAKMTHVPYRGGAPATAAVIAGEVQLVFTNMSDAVGQLEGGKVRALAVTTSKRSPSAPSVPTLAEQGSRANHENAGNGLFAPKGTPQAIVDRLAQIAAEMAKDPRVQQQMAKFGSDAVSNTPEEFAEMLRDETRCGQRSSSRSGRNDQSRARHHRRLRHLRSAGAREGAAGRIKSPWGEPSAPLRIGEIAGLPVVFLSRHDKGHRLSPSDINYRANIDVLKRAGVTDLVSLSACGSFKEELPPGTFVLVDQFVDRTFNRAELVLRQGLRRARVDGASGRRRACRTASPPPPAPRASSWCAAAPMCAWRARSSPPTRRA